MPSSNGYKKGYSQGIRQGFKKGFRKGFFRAKSFYARRKAKTAQRKQTRQNRRYSK